VGAEKKLLFIMESGGDLFLGIMEEEKGKSILNIPVSAATRYSRLCRI
jgi:hypothetical protein